MINLNDSSFELTLDEDAILDSMQNAQDERIYGAEADPHFVQSDDDFALDMLVSPDSQTLADFLKTITTRSGNINYARSLVAAS